MANGAKKDILRTDRMQMEYFTFGTGERPLVILPGVSVKSVMDAADAVAEAMASLGLRAADVFGASLGGMIALRLALEHPALVRDMVLGSTMARSNETARTVAGGWVRLAEAGDVPALNRAMAEKMCPERVRAEYEAFLTGLHENVTEAELERFARQTRAGVGFDVYDRLPEIRCPVLVLGAENDRVSTPAASREIAERLGCELYLYEGDYSHGVYDEAPDYRERMLAFFLAADAQR